MIIKRIKVLAIVSVIFTLVACEVNKEGVWEHYREDDGIYVCIPEDPDYLYETSDRIYHEDKSCSDLGYTEKGSSVGYWHFVNPDGEHKPGENGAFWDDYQTSSGGSGGSSGGSCSLDNYNGPEFDIQADSQCKTAYLYNCNGLYDERDIACDLYYQWESNWNGVGSFPDCPYCPNN